MVAIDRAELSSQPRSPYVEAVVALLTLALMEIVLGIDNLVFIAILTAQLPREQQGRARRLGLIAALGMRILLLLSLNWVMKLDTPLFHLSDIGIPVEWLVDEEASEAHREVVNGISVKDLILLAGGMFLIAKSVWEIHHKVDGKDHETKKQAPASFGAVLTQVALFDIIFSLDSVITAVGMARQIWVMIAAVIIAVGVMVAFANPVGRFVERHPTITILALSFLILIGMLLVAEGLGQHLDKGYIYFAMAFSLVVEMLNMRVRKQAG
jgi:predicted tellurium resistance membrane protein TerC